MNTVAANPSYTPDDLLQMDGLFELVHGQLVVNPTFQYVRIHRPDGTSVFLQASDTFTGESVLPAFSVKVGELMPHA
jgi:hypothetical protein